MSLVTMPLPSGPDRLLVQDDQARIEALDTSRSFLVQAPAGSGKTELLTQRLLALLSVVEKPEHILAITFTVAATAEMRRRVIDALERADELLKADELSEQDAGKYQHAIAALRQSRKLGWSLLEQPQRLNIQTIDSLCLRIAHDAPLLSRLGGQLQPTEDAEPLYALAARRTIEHLGDEDSELSQSLKQLLRLRDVNLANCEGLIAQMLQDRDQWLEEFFAARTLSESQWAELRERREEPLRREHERVCGQLTRLIRRAPQLFEDLLELATYACGNEPTEAIHELAKVHKVDALRELLHFTCLRDFLLTKGGTWRLTANKKLGFPALSDGGSAERKLAFEELVVRMEEVAGLREALHSTRSLPDQTFSDGEWQTIRSIFTVLLHASAELRVVFAERSIIDFVEAGITAENALRDDGTRRSWSEKIHHLLVDEFQDTSRRQYTLLKNITQDWDMTENRTCFLVGDPMQSIYLFRKAELALFDEVQEHGFGADADNLHFSHLTLTRNFRSTASIVEPINAMFEMEMRNGAAGAGRFTRALADDDVSSDSSLRLHANFDPSRTDKSQTETTTAVDILRRHLPALEQARADSRDFRIGVLVRKKKHGIMLAAALREAGIPYRAVDMEALNQRQEILDLLSLMRALTHPLDRIAWLSVLRAPWCGLSLADLHILSGSDDKRLGRKPMRELLPHRLSLISEDGRLRATRVQQVLEMALAQRFADPYAASPNGFSAWIEQTWKALGGPNCIHAGQLENVRAFFRLLAKVKPSGIEASQAGFNQQLEKLFAQPDPRAPENCSIQFMTIHKAKGLGFDVVLVPQLADGKPGGRSDNPLLRWLVRKQHDSDHRELLIAPIGAKGGTSSATYQWLGKLEQQEESAELHRLLYVACTRARTELHLFCNLSLKASKEGMSIADPTSGTLLKCGWAYLRPFAYEQLAFHQPAPISSLEPGIVLDMAAATAPVTQQIMRLPVSWLGTTLENDGQPPKKYLAESEQEHALRQRTGSLASRARGTVLHALFESLATLRGDDAKRDVSGSIAHWKSVAAALLRQAGLHHRELEAELKSVLAILQTASSDLDAQWILGQRPYARSESSWTTGDEDALSVMRCDRVFLAGSEPHREGEDHLWVVDYKTAEGDNAFLLDEQKRHEPQLQRYATALREATQTALPLRLALYYPALPHLLWWVA